MKTLRYYLLIIAAWLIAAIILSPALLAFTQGAHGEPTIWNIIGIAYIALLIVAGKLIAKKL